MLQNMLAHLKGWILDVWQLFAIVAAVLIKTLWYLSAGVAIPVV